MKSFKIYTHYDEPNRFFIRTKEFRLPKEGEFISYPTGSNIKVDGIIPCYFDFKESETYIYKEVIIKKKRGKG